MTRGRPNPLHQRFPRRLRQARKAAGIALSGLAIAAKLGKNAGAQLEDGTRSPRVSTVEQMARVLKVSAGWLAFGLGDVEAPAERGPLRCEGLAARARDARTVLGVSMRAVDRRSGLGESATRYLEGGTLPSIDQLEVLARALQVSPAWLAYGELPRELPRRGSRPAPLPAPQP